MRKKPGLKVGPFLFSLNNLNHRSFFGQTVRPGKAPFKNLYVVKKKVFPGISGS